jgi:hypothetical protein
MRLDQNAGRGVFVNGKLYIYDDDMSPPEVPK